MSYCVEMCCRESSWLGVRRMLRNEGLNKLIHKNNYATNTKF